MSHTRPAASCALHDGNVTVFVFHENSQLLYICQICEKKKPFLTQSYALVAE